MQIGELIHPIAIEALRESEDGQGGTTDDDWYTLKPLVFSHIRPLTGDELTTAQQVDPRVSHEITLRYDRDIQARQRVVYQGRIFNIVGPPINVDERNRELRLRCVELA